MNIAKQSTLVLAALLGLVASVEARTWRVMRDGTGDYATIQPAIDGASPGDTILLGPGRYIEHAPFWPGVGATDKSWPRETYAAVGVDSLTIMGEDRDQVIIGPIAPRIPSDESMGVSNRASGTLLTIKNLQAENLFNGCYLYGRMRIVNCLFRRCDQGVVYWSPQGIVVEGCEFNSNDTGVITFSGAANATISNCLFALNQIGVDMIYTSHCVVADCTFEDDYVGVQFEQGSTGEIRTCHIRSRNACISVMAPSVANLVNNDCQGDQWYGVVTDAEVTATGNIIRGGNSATIQLGLATVPARFHQNHILKGSGFAVRSTLIEGPLRHFDFTNNYWGTTNADSIRAWIEDHNDDPTGLYGQIDFEPFSSTPLPTEKKSLGGVKGLYR